MHISQLDKAMEVHQNKLGWEALLQDVTAGTFTIFRVTGDEANPYVLASQTINRDEREIQITAREIIARLVQARVTECERELQSLGVDFVVKERPVTEIKQITHDAEPENQVA